MLKTKSRSRLRTVPAGRRFRPLTGPSARRAPPHPDPKVVHQAEKIFAEMGMTPSEAIALFYRQTVLRGDFPITELIPNEKTQAVIREARAGIGIIRGRSLAQMLAEAEVDDCVS